MHSQRPARRASRFPGVGCGVRRATQRFSSTAEHLNCGLRGGGWTSLRTSDPGCGGLSRPMSGTVELGTLGLSAAKLHSRYDRWPDLIVASARPWLRSPPDGLPVPVWLPWHRGAVGKPAESGRVSVAGTVPPLCRNAVLQYSRQTSAKRVRRPGHRPRDVRFVRRMRGPARVRRLPSRRASQTTMRRGCVRVTANGKVWTPPGGPGNHGCTCRASAT